MRRRTKQPSSTIKKLAIVAAALLGVASIVLLAPSSPMPGQAQGSSRYYPESGHTVDPIFLTYFDDHGGLEIFGYPITEAFIDPETGSVVQYFENLRLEVGFDPSGNLQVTASPLGRLLGVQKPAGSQSQTDAGCRFYAQTGHQVCYMFSDYYEKKGGPALFGYPISPFRIEGDIVLQDYENARLIWNPEQGQVSVAALGRIHFDRMGYPPSLLEPKPVEDAGEAERVDDFRIRASVGRSVLKSDGVQEVFIVVEDQDGRPVQGAAVMLIAQFAQGERTVIMPSTDEMGRSQFSLNYAGEPPGSTVALEFWVVYGDIRRMTRDSFLVWW